MKTEIILLCLFPIICLTAFLLRFVLIKKTGKPGESDSVSIQNAVKALSEYTNNVMTYDLHGKRKKSAELKKEQLTIKLRNALRLCSSGDITSKVYVKEYIRAWLIDEYGLNEENYCEMIPYNKTEKLTAADKFDAILFTFSRKSGLNAFDELMKELPDNISVITADDISLLYQKTGRPGYRDALEIITQRIYQTYKGHGVIDTLRDLNIDGVSGGVSGVVSAGAGEKANFNSIWVFYHGRMIHLAFLGFGSEPELQRVCKNVYRYANPGQLSAARGYIANEMHDGSRVVVVRPPFSEGWAFFIRKFGMGMLNNINELITDDGAQTVIDFLRILIGSSQVFGITGAQGCGKTTMLKALIGFIPKEYTIRVQELVFELHLRDVYPERNIVSFKETSGVSGREGLDIQKKTDGTVSIIGEVASASVASWLVMVAQVASEFTIFTHHAKTSEYLISALRNDLMLEGGFNNEKVAEEQVRAAIRFDVHMCRTQGGKRYIERITEILPKGPEKTRDIIVFKDNSYRICGHLSEETYREMSGRLNDKERMIIEQYKAC